ncbi:E3 ubiquitin-protein ligase Topors [Dermacentor silvarum]|uniref:E3 ubiquitin-protein ligase Topors n=1 Tax=Dermacentor silvarum TaxID=543639 RepID=UPI0021009DCB|nr:E3 ubiquitin-protein ligase Topors [Dermacentor silvarum]
MPSACSSSGSVAASETLASAVKLEGAKRDNAAPPRPPSSKSPERSSSPEQSCPICLDPLEDKSFAGSCFHTFCFSCLLEWSKVKAECPMCKQCFKSIFHNVRSLEDYDQYFVHNNAPQASLTVRAATAGAVTMASTSRSSPLSGTVLLAHHLADSPMLLTRQFSTGATRSSGIWTSTERQLLYDLDLWVYPSNNRRSSHHFTPAYIRDNPACTHRLIPWLNRELVALLGDDEAQITSTTELVLELITHYEVCSLEFAEHVRSFLGTRTEHFVHELAAFVASPLDMVPYDRVAVYNLRAHVLAHGTPATAFLRTPESSLEDTSPVAPVTFGVHSDPSQQSTSGLHQNVTANLVDPESDNSDCMIVSSVMPAVPMRSRTPIVIVLSSSDEGDAESRATALAAVAAAVSTTPLQQPARRCKPMAGKKRLLQFSNSDTSTASDTDSDDWWGRQGSAAPAPESGDAT